MTKQHRERLTRVARLAERNVLQLTVSLNTRDIDGWWERVETHALRTVRNGTEATSTLTAGYLRRHAGLERVRVSPARARFEPERARTSLRVSGPIAFKTHLLDAGDVDDAVRVMRSQLAGSVDRLVRFGDRDTTMQTIRGNHTLVGYQRVGGGSPCAFCTMLISRGPVYGAQSVEFESHPRCNCTAEPVYNTDAELSPQAERARTLWDEAGGDLKQLRQNMAGV